MQKCWPLSRSSYHADIVCGCRTERISVVSQSYTQQREWQIKRLVRIIIYFSDASTAMFVYLLLFVPHTGFSPSFELNTNRRSHVQAICGSESSNAACRIRQTSNPTYTTGYRRGEHLKPRRSTKVTPQTAVGDLQQAIVMMRVSISSPTGGAVMIFLIQQTPRHHHRRARLLETNAHEHDKTRRESSNAFTCSFSARCHDLPQ